MLKLFQVFQWVRTLMCALTECTSAVFCIWPDDGSVNRNMSPYFSILILITNICCVIDWINCYITAKHKGMVPIKEKYSLWKPENLQPVQNSFFIHVAYTIQLLSDIFLIFVLRINILNSSLQAVCSLLFVSMHFYPYTAPRNHISAPCVIVISPKFRIQRPCSIQNFEQF